MGTSKSNRIAEYRKASNISQRELAKKIGVSNVTIFDIEHGYVDTKLTVAYRLAKFFNVTIEHLFGTYGEKRTND